MFYFSGQDVEIAGASPETLVKLQDGVLQTFPLAGTRPRGRTVQEDETLEKELLSDPKELAEHNMLVDLGEKRHRQTQPVRFGGGGKIYVRRTVFPRDASGLHRQGRNPGG